MSLPIYTDALGNPLRDPAKDTFPCAYCDGEFLPEDMDGEHCLACTEEIFGEGGLS